MYFGHTWSPVLELSTPSNPLMHGHAISIDMCFSATVSLYLNLLPAASHHRFLAVFSAACLALDHDDFTLDLLREATRSTVATRDGCLRAVVPTGCLGTFEILRDVEGEVLEEAWRLHKRICGGWERKGKGVQVTVDARWKDVGLGVNGMNGVNGTNGVDTNGTKGGGE